jgi:hypothetical protein
LLRLLLGLEMNDLRIFASKPTLILRVGLLGMLGLPVYGLL